MCGRTRAVLLFAGMTGAAGTTCPWAATGRTACEPASVTIVALTATTIHNVTAAMAVAPPGLALILLQLRKPRIRRRPVDSSVPVGCARRRSGRRVLSPAGVSDRLP